MISFNNTISFVTIWLLFGLTTVNSQILDYFRDDHTIILNAIKDKDWDKVIQKVNEPDINDNPTEEYIFLISAGYSVTDDNNTNKKLLRALNLVLDRTDKIDFDAKPDLLHLCLRYHIPPSFIKKMLERGFDVNKQTYFAGISKNVSPLIQLCRYSISKNKVENAILLLVNGADTSLKDGTGKTAFDYISNESVSKNPRYYERSMNNIKKLRKILTDPEKYIAIYKENEYNNTNNYSSNSSSTTTTRKRNPCDNFSFRETMRGATTDFGDWVNTTIWIKCGNNGAEKKIIKSVIKGPSNITQYSYANSSDKGSLYNAAKYACGCD